MHRLFAFLQGLFELLLLFVAYITACYRVSAAAGKKVTGWAIAFYTMLVVLAVQAAIVLAKNTMIVKVLLLVLGAIMATLLLMTRMNPQATVLMIAPFATGMAMTTIGLVQCAADAIARPYLEARQAAKTKQYCEKHMDDLVAEQKARDEARKDEELPYAEEIVEEVQGTTVDESVQDTDPDIDLDQT